MSKLEIGQLVRGPVFGYTNIARNRVTGTVEGLDRDGDPRVLVTEVGSSDNPGWIVGSWLYLDHRHTEALDSSFGDPKPTRVKVLAEASDLITGDRNVSYGEPTQNFQDIADVWTTYLNHKLKDGETISPADTAWMMIAVKMVRAKAGPSRDNWVDAAGYAGCGAECDAADGTIEG